MHLDMSGLAVHTAAVSWCVGQIDPQALEHEASYELTQPGYQTLSVCMTELASRQQSLSEVCRLAEATVTI